jgi:hypothetical protein
MKEFHAELAANPGHYSYGYSVYGEVEKGDDLSDLFERGFQPFVGAPSLPPMMYMNRTTRVRAKEFVQGWKINSIINAVKSESEIVATDYLWHEYPHQQHALDFILEYFVWRHGGASMPRSRLIDILGYMDRVHVIEYRIGERVAGYSIELHERDSFFLWYFAYAKELRKNLGMRIALDTTLRAKKAGKTYAYLGSSYGWHMRYKAKFQPLEYWNGYQWVLASSGEFRTLVAEDALRVVVSVDEWRSKIRDYYYQAPFRYSTWFAEMRFIYDLLTATPRVGIALVFFLCIMCLLIAVSLFP